MHSIPFCRSNSHQPDSSIIKGMPAHHKGTPQCLTHQRHAQHRSGISPAEALVDINGHRCPHEDVGFEADVNLRHDGVVRVECKDGQERVGVELRVVIILGEVVSLK